MRSAFACLVLIYLFSVITGAANAAANNETRATPDSDIITFFPNGKGTPLGRSTPVQLTLQGASKKVNVRLSVRDSENKRGTNTTRVISIRVLTQPSVKQVVSINNSDSFPFPAVLSDVDGDGQEDLCIPVAADMRTVTWAVLRFDPSSLRYVPMRGLNMTPIKINGKATKTVTLTNPENQGAWLHEHESAGFGPVYVRCSHFDAAGTIVPTFELQYDFIDDQNGIGQYWKIKLLKQKHHGGHNLSLTRSVSFAEQKLGGKDTSQWSCEELSQALSRVKGVVQHY